MNLKFIERDSPEWKLIWGELEKAFGDTKCECPDTGEVWQYMGSVPHGYMTEHQFRHRSYQGERKYWSCKTFEVIPCF